MIIEDNQTNLQLMSYLLKYFGHEVTEAHNGGDGVETARREHPDLILMDVHMPGMDGYTAARAIGSVPELQKIPIVAVTALAMVGDRERVLAGRFNGYIPKPINPETFVKEVEGFLSDPRASATLPVASPPAASTHARETSAFISKSGQRATILYVDNTAANLQLICSTLEPFGYKVIAVKTVKEALAAAGETTVDLILSDVHMPHVDGYQFLKLVKADPRLGAIPFAMISGSMKKEEDSDIAFRLGAVKFICRPIEPQALLAEIEACLAMK